MKPKKIPFVILVSVFAFIFSAKASPAGSPQSHRWEGVAIGVGVVLLGKTIFDNLHDGQSAYASSALRPVIIEHHYYNTPPEPSGHWETRRQWVPPSYKKVWNPGHYNRRGRWVNGCWMRIETESGHWVRSQVWVPH